MIRAGLFKLPIQILEKTKISTPSGFIKTDWVEYLKLKARMEQTPTDSISVQGHEYDSVGIIKLTIRAYASKPVTTGMRMKIGNKFYQILDASEDVFNKIYKIKGELIND